MSQNKKIEIQHYVPRFYLKNFAKLMGKSHIINCLDKPTSNKFPIDIKKIGCEKFFYDTSKDTEQVIEKFLAHYESQFSVAYKKLIEKKDLLQLSDAEKEMIAYFLATQWMRTKSSRDDIEETIRKLEDRFSTEQLAPVFKKQIDDAKTEESIKNLHIRTIIQAVPMVAQIILKMKWTLVLNKTEMSYWTSDNPVTLYNKLDLFPYGNLGLTSKGIQFVCDPVMFSFMPVKLETMDVQTVIFENHLQVIWSTRHIFSLEEDFSLAEKILEEDPKLKKAGSKKVNVR